MTSRRAEQRHSPAPRNVAATQRRRAASPSPQAQRTQDNNTDDFDEQYNPEYDDDSELVGEDPDQISDGGEYDGLEEDEDDDDGLEEDGDAHLTGGVLPCPPNLRDISSLAAWTSSSSKPGCGIPELRAASTNLYWQSDGPQPHNLSIHFSKVVEIVAIRIYLNHEQDESYTPLQIEWAAGMGYNDLVPWEVQIFDKPNGWMWVNMGNVDDALVRRALVKKSVVRFDPAGPFPFGHSPDDDDDDDSPEDTSKSGDVTNPTDYYSDSDDMNDIAKNQRTIEPESGAPPPLRSGRRRKPLYPILRCMLLQMRILENHENGKDTHMRGVQIFARETREQKRARQKHVEESKEEKNSNSVQNLAGLDPFDLVSWGIGRPAEGASGTDHRTSRVSGAGSGSQEVPMTAAQLLNRLMAAQSSSSQTPIPTPGAPTDKDKTETKKPNTDWLRIPDLR